MKLTAKEMPTALHSSALCAQLIKGINAENKGKPQAFKLRAQLLAQGRSNTPVAATDDLTVIVKVYATGGENALHQHPNEDHVFVILQGSASFYDEEGETATLGVNEGYLVPKGALYRFHCNESAGPLVMLRVGTPNYTAVAKPFRTDDGGKDFQGDTKKNNSVEVKVLEGAYFG